MKFIITHLNSSVLHAKSACKEHLFQGIKEKYKPLTILQRQAQAGETKQNDKFVQENIEMKSQPTNYTFSFCQLTKYQPQKTKRVIFCQLSKIEVSLNFN